MHKALVSPGVDSPTVQGGYCNHRQKYLTAQIKATPKNDLHCAA
jgi:hypothetical protein